MHLTHTQPSSIAPFFLCEEAGRGEGDEATGEGLKAPEKDLAIGEGLKLQEKE